MNISILILNYNDFELSEKCLKSIFAYKIKPKFEVIFVDNASTKTSFNSFKKIWKPKIKFIRHSHNLGFAGGINVALPQCQGKYLLVLNPDIEILENTINKLYEFIISKPQCVIAGPQLIYPNKTIQDSYRRFPTLTDLVIKRTFLRKIFKQRMQKYLMHTVDNQNTQSVDWLVGACLMIKNDFLNKIKGFDERFFLFFEDTDLGKQASKHNLEVWYYPEAKAYHNHQRLSGQNFWDAIFKKTFYIHLHSAVKYWWKWRKNCN